MAFLWALIFLSVIMLVIALVQLTTHSDEKTGDTVTVVRPLDGRHIKGRPLRSDDDWKRWFVMKGFTEGLSRHLSELEEEIDAVYTGDPSFALSEWFRYYEKYRSVCLDYGIWNDYLGDRRPFVADAIQLGKEDRLKEDMRLRAAAAAANRAEEWRRRDLVLNYLSTQPYHKSTRRQLLHDLEESGHIPAAELSRSLTGMIRAGVLYSGADKSGKQMISKARAKRKKAAPPELPASVYDPGNYVYVDKTAYYKALYTVGSPQNIDKAKNTCEFVSMSSGETYHTSLTKCTCPVYQDPLHPCKHMLALAIHLGYFDPGRI